MENIKEEWRPVKGFEGYYEVSNLGRVKSLDHVDSIGRICYGRIKHLSSIYKKITEKNTTLKNIYDIAAARIIVKNFTKKYKNTLHLSHFVVL